VTSQDPRLRKGLWCFSRRVCGCWGLRILEAWRKMWLDPFEGGYGCYYGSCELENELLGAASNQWHKHQIVKLRCLGCKRWNWVQRFAWCCDSKERTLVVGFGKVEKWIGWVENGSEGHINVKKG